MIKDDGSVIHFNNPKVQASLNANTFAVSGHAESKQITEMLPGILNHLGADGFNQLKRLASSVNAGNVAAGGIDDEDDDVPELVEDFESASKAEKALNKPPAVTEDKEVKSKVKKDLAEDTQDTPKIVEATPKIVEATPKIVEVTQSSEKDDTEE